MALVNYHVKADISNTSKTGKFQTLQKLNNTLHTLTANRKKKEEITGKIRKYLKDKRKWNYNIPKLTGNNEGSAKGEIYSYNSYIKKKISNQQPNFTT